MLSLVCQTRENRTETSQNCKADLVQLPSSYNLADLKSSGIHRVEHYHAEDNFWASWEVYSWCWQLSIDVDANIKGNPIWTLGFELRAICRFTVGIQRYSKLTVWAWLTCFHQDTHVALTLLTSNFLLATEVFRFNSIRFFMVPHERKTSLNIFNVLCSITIYFLTSLIRFLYSEHYIHFLNWHSNFINIFLHRCIIKWLHFASIVLLFLQFWTIYWY